MANQNTAERVLELARGYLGRTDGDTFIRKYNDYFKEGMPYGVPWCAIGRSVVHHEAGVSDSLNPHFSGCITGRRLYERLGRFHVRGSCTPQPGWDIIFDWDKENGNGEDHVGIVEKVTQTVVQTIEFNSGNGIVARQTYPLYSAVIAGYCEITYKTETEEEEMTQDKFNQMMDVYLAERNKKPADEWAEPAIAMCKEWRIMEGDDTGAMRPQSFIKREEAAQMFYSLLGRGQDADPWAKDVWDKAVAAGVLDGTNPRAPFTREQAAMVFYRLGLIPGAPTTE